MKPKRLWRRARRTTAPGAGCCAWRKRHGNGSSSPVAAVAGDELRRMRAWRSSRSRTRDCGRKAPPRRSAGNSTPDSSGASTDCSAALPGYGRLRIAGVRREAEHRMMAHEERVRRRAREREAMLELRAVIAVHRVRSGGSGVMPTRDESNTMNCVSRIACRTARRTARCSRRCRRRPRSLQSCRGASGRGSRKRHQPCPARLHDS